MSGYRNIVLKLVGFLALTIMVPTSAEVDHGIYGTGGRSFSGGTGSAGLSGTLSSCAAGRAGTGGAVGGVAVGPVTGAAPGAQGGVDLGGGILSASVPDGAVAARPSTSATATLDPQTILNTRCLACHNTSATAPKRITAAAGMAALSSGKMPKPPGTISTEERTALIEAWTKGTLL